MNDKEHNSLSYKDFLKATAFACIITTPVILAVAFTKSASNPPVKQMDLSVSTNNPLFPFTSSHKLHKK